MRTKICCDEGVPAERIVRVGNIMIDSFEMLRAQDRSDRCAGEIGLTGDYGVVTLHRPVNVDDRAAFDGFGPRNRRHRAHRAAGLCGSPAHRARLEEFGLDADLRAEHGLHLVEPMGYMRFMALVRKARFIITDSGGIQEETTYLDVPCLTLRETTERPITVTMGSNRSSSAISLPPRCATSWRAMGRMAGGRRCGTERPLIAWSKV